MRNPTWLHWASLLWHWKENTILTESNLPQNHAQFKEMSLFKHFNQQASASSSFSILCVLDVFFYWFHSRISQTRLYATSDQSQNFPPPLRFVACCWLTEYNSFNFVETPIKVSRVFQYCGKLLWRFFFFHHCDVKTHY